MFLVFDDAIVSEEDDKTMLGQFPGSAALFCLAEEKAIDPVVVYAEKMAKGLLAAGFEVVEGGRGLGGSGPFLMQVIHRQGV